MKKTTRLAAALCVTALFTPLAHAQNLYVGSNSSGVTTDFTSGTNAYANTFVGYEQGADSNTLNVLNANTVLTNSGDLTVGGSGSGNRLVISNGGTVTADSVLWLGQSAGSDNNSIVVTGTGSSLGVSFLVIGDLMTSGNTGNTLEVSAGGSLTSGNTYIYGSSSAVLVTGSGSTWTNSGEFTVGLGGLDEGSSVGNSLVISNGGKLASGVDGSGFMIGYAPGDNQNSVTVTGASSLLTISGDVTVGFNGSSNSLVVSGGGTVANANGFIGRESTDNTALVTGAGSLWTNSGTLTVGDWGGGAAGGTLTVASGGTVAAAGGITLAMQAGNTGTLNIGRFGTNDTAGTIITPTIDFGAGTGVINLNQSNSTTVSAAISGNGSVNQLGAGTTILSGANTYSGTTTVAAGELSVSSVGSIGAGGVTVQDGATLRNNGTIGGTTTINSGGTLTGNSGSFGDVFIQGLGNLVGSNTATNTTLDGGSLSLTGSLHNTGDLTVGGSVSGSRLVISNGSTVLADDNTLYLGQSAVSDSNSIVVTGTGSSLAVGDVSIGDLMTSGNTGNTLEVSAGGSLTSGNTYIYGSSSAVLVTGSGSTWTNSGEFTVGLGGLDEGSSVGNSLVISNGGKLASGLDGSDIRVYSSDFIIGYNSGDNQNSVTVTGAGSLLTNGGDLFVGYGGSSNSLVVSGGGTVANANGFIGLGTDNTALVTGAGSLWTNSGTLTVGGSPFSGAAGGTLTVASGGTVAAAGGITIAAQAGDTGTLNIGRFGTNDTAGTIITPTIAFGAGTGAINFNQSNSTTLSAAISGNGSVNQLGSGATTLSASNTYTGATTVADGKLVVDGSINNSTVTVNNGGTLAGSGSVGGIVLNLGSTINPGNSPGTQSVAGNVVWNAGANYNWQIYDTTLGAGTGWDLVNATGTLDLTALTVGSEFNINLWSLSAITPDTNGPALNFDPNQSYTWTILTAAGGISGFTGSSQFDINIGAFNGTGGFANALNGGSFSIAQSLDGKDLNLVFTAAGGAAVPEPGTWAAAALLVGGAAFLRWRKRAKAS